MSKKLYRKESEGSIAGVAAGLAQYFGVDVTIIRLIFVLLTLAGGPGIILYIALAIVMPGEPKEYKYKNDQYV